MNEKNVNQTLSNKFLWGEKIALIMVQKSVSQQMTLKGNRYK